jgi:hypothetical protein
MGRLGAVFAVSVVTLGLAAGIAAGSSPPTSAYMEPSPVPAPDSAAKAFLGRLAPSLRKFTAEELAQGIVLTTADASSSLQGGASAAVHPRHRDTVRVGRAPSGEGTVSSGLLERAGVGTAGGGGDARWLLVLAAVLAAGGLASRFVVDRRPTSNTTE